jgi:hypothetical protein
VSDLDGKTRLILDDPNGSTECPHWISKDRLVLDRFVGARTIKGAELKPNTSTVVTIEPLALKDTPKKWTIESVCAKSNNGFVRSDQGRLLIAKNIDHFETVDPSPAPCSDCRFVGYAAQSCYPFFVEQPLSTTTELFSINPMDWQKQKPGVDQLDVFRERAVRDPVFGAPGGGWGHTGQIAFDRRGEWRCNAVLSQRSRQKDDADFARANRLD